MITKETIKKFKDRLEKEKETIEKELKNFAKEDKRIKGDWDTCFPKWDGDSLESAADEVEEYSNLLPIEHSLESRLKDINLALEKIKNGSYGICEKCGKEISKERLNASPEARLCKNCK